jgi:hypothetical protein
MNWGSSHFIVIGKLAWKNVADSRCNGRGNIVMMGIHSEFQLSERNYSFLKLFYDLFRNIFDKLLEN